MNDGHRVLCRDCIMVLSQSLCRMHVFLCFGFTRNIDLLSYGFSRIRGGLQTWKLEATVAIMTALWLPRWSRARIVKLHRVC